MCAAATHSHAALRSSILLCCDLLQFDFGPRGGDIHVARGPFAFLSKSADGKMQRLVPGEVRGSKSVWPRVAGMLQAGRRHCCRVQAMLAIEEGSSPGAPCCSVPPQVRERRLTRLPDAHMYVGRTPLSLEDIRAWNALQEQGSMVRRCSGCTAGEHVRCFAACGCAGAVVVKEL